MKALSVSTPWPTAIEQFDKRVENRSRWARHPHLVAQARRLVGQDLAIQSSKTHDPDGVAHLLTLTGRTYTRRDVPQGAVTSVVRVTGLLLPGDVCPPGQEGWYFGSLALVLDDVRVLLRPVLMVGALGVLTLPHEVEREVQAQLEGLA